MDWSIFNGQVVDITIRRGIGGVRSRHFIGIFDDFSKYEICIRNFNDRVIWITKPTCPFDEIEVIKNE